MNATLADRPHRFRSTHPPLYVKAKPALHHLVGTPIGRVPARTRGGPAQTQDWGDPAASPPVSRCWNSPRSCHVPEAHAPVRAGWPACAAALIHQS